MKERGKSQRLGARGVSVLAVLPSEVLIAAFF